MSNPYYKVPTVILLIQFQRYPTTITNSKYGTEDYANSSTFHFERRKKSTIVEVVGISFTEIIIFSLVCRLMGTTYLDVSRCELSLFVLKLKTARNLFVLCSQT